MNALLFLSAAHAELPSRPERVEALEEFPDCPRSFEIRPGQKWEPPTWLVDADGVVQCRAILEPYTSLADLLNIETSYNELRKLYRIDLEVTELSLDHYKGRALAAEAELLEPLPFWDRPAVARWGGRLEVIAVVGVTAWGLNEVSK